MTIIEEQRACEIIRRHYDLIDCGCWTALSENQYNYVLGLISYAFMRLDISYETKLTLTKEAGEYYLKAIDKADPYF
jgi:hypothetical protein